VPGVAMHVASSDLRSVNGGGIVLRFAKLGERAFVQADVPAEGSAGTPLEEACTRPHWGLVMDGEVELERGDRRALLGPATAFHVPAGGPAHRFRALHGARMASFDPIDETIDLSEAGLRALGLKLTADGASPLSPSLVPTAAELAELATGRVEARGAMMGSLVITRACFGPKSGYATNPCHLSHWGIVTSGSVVLETPDETAILGPGDVFACPPGPPGHRILAADPASLIDYTPLAEISTSAQIADWRREAFRRIAGHGRRADRVDRVEIAAL